MISTFTELQIIHWQVTTRLLGAIQSSEMIWQSDENRPSLNVRTGGFRDYVDSAAVYKSLEGFLHSHVELQECDAITRLQTLYDVMCAAALHADTRESVLKVFIAPDGYFSDDVSGAYSLAQTRLIKHILHHVICSDSRFENWLILPGTIKWQKEESGLGGVNNALVSMPPLNTSAVVVYRGADPLILSDGKVLSDACFLIEPVSDMPELILPKTPWSSLDLNRPRVERRILELKRHIFSIGSIVVGIEINEENDGAELRNNCLSEALISMGRSNESLDLQVLLSSGRTLNKDYLNIRVGGIASSLNGLVGIAGQIPPVQYQIYKPYWDDAGGKKSVETHDFFYRKYFKLPKLLRLTGKPERHYCYNALGQEESLVFNYDRGALRVLKPLSLTDS